jgi:hypothetical protein
VNKQGTEMTTKLQNQMLIKIAESEFQPTGGSVPGSFDDLDWVWADCIIEDAEDKGVFTSLQNAGLVKHSGHKGRDAAVCLTLDGFNEYSNIKG